MTLSEFIEELKPKKIGIIGMGVSNMPLIERLAKSGCTVCVCDKRSASELGEDYNKLSALGVSFSLGDTYLDELDFDILFRTPGLMPFEPRLVSFVEKGGVLTSEMETFFKLCPCRIIAVTGSDGKTTTTTIISELLKAEGYTVHLGGNIGNPLLCEVDDMKPEDFAVLELSSFQLHSMYCVPDVAVITNISPNHLDKHLDYEDYYDAKSSIFINQSEDMRLVLNLDNGLSPHYSDMAKSRISYFSRKNEVTDGVFCENGIVYSAKNGVKQDILNAEDIKIPGTHNLENYMAAFAAVEGLVSFENCLKVAKEFSGVEHRLELVRVKNSVSFINDSIGTSPSRTSAGLHALRKKPLLIAGGYDKHIPFDSLGDDICLLTKALYLSGATAEKIAEAVRASSYYTDDFKMLIIDDFKAAVLKAAEDAEEGDIVLLSPACAAFDRFKNFMERGRYFKQIVMEL